MCGRYVTPKAEGLQELFRLDVLAEDLPDQNYNAKPTFGDRPEDYEPPVPIVLEREKDGVRSRRLEAAEWPFVPTWSKVPRLDYQAFNATAEGITEKGTWLDAIKHHRAIFPAVGYFETQGSGKARKRFYFHPESDELLALGGLWAWWRLNSESEWHLKAAIITVAAPPGVAEIHHRAPLVLPHESWDAWLDPTTTAEQPFIDAHAQASKPLIADLARHEVAWLDEDSPRMIASL